MIRMTGSIGLMDASPPPRERAPTLQARFCANGNSDTLVDRQF
jgi:hypothetical protein